MTSGALAINPGPERDHLHHRILAGDNSALLGTLPAGVARMIYIDPPFHTGRRQSRQRITVKRSDEGDRVGFGGRRYRQELREDGASGSSYSDDNAGNYVADLIVRVAQSLRCLTPDGSLFVHLDSREVHYVKVALDDLLGRACFMNEIIWAYDFGGRSKRRWPAKHDTILWYAVNPDDYVFNEDGIDRIPYMAPGLVTREKAQRGKRPTDVWWHTIVPTNSKEKTGYPTQKPLGILRRLVRVHTDPGDCVLDFFAGSGTTGHAAALEGRGFILIDREPSAIAIMRQRLGAYVSEPRTS